MADSGDTNTSAGDFFVGQEFKNLESAKTFLVQYNSFEYVHTEASFPANRKLHREQHTRNDVRFGLSNPDTRA